MVAFRPRFDADEEFGVRSRVVFDGPFGGEGGLGVAVAGMSTGEGTLASGFWEIWNFWSTSGVCRFFSSLWLLLSSLVFSAASSIEELVEEVRVVGRRLNDMKEDGDNDGVADFHDAPA